MPIYRYYCAECQVEEDVIVPMREMNTARNHTCGSRMERLPTSPAPAQFPLTGRDKVLHTLNKEKGLDLPARPEDRPRMERAMARGLNVEKPTVGRGFCPGG